MDPVTQIRKNLAAGRIPPKLKAAVESRFQPGMTWDNYGYQWQVYPDPNPDRLSPQWLKNPQRPYKRSVKVSPIRSVRAIGQIKAMLRDHPRNYALFVFGINTNLRASDLIRITVGQVRDLPPGASFELREKKTGKPRRITLNNGVASAVSSLLAPHPDRSASAPLFRSQRGGPLTVPSVNRLVKSWCGAACPDGNYGSHTLRKTWGYHAWKTGIDIPRLMVMFNHSSQKQTLDYLCIQAEEIREVYLKVEL